METSAQDMQLYMYKYLQKNEKKYTHTHTHTKLDNKQFDRPIDIAADFTFYKKKELMATTMITMNAAN